MEFTKVFTKEELSLLKRHKWIVEQENNKAIVRNRLTGCYMEATLGSHSRCSDFVKELIKEIKEEEGAAKERTGKSLDDFFNRHGYNMICEAPLELTDSDENLITGECAHWLKVYLGYKP